MKAVSPAMARRIQDFVQLEARIAAMEHEHQQQQAEYRERLGKLRSERKVISEELASGKIQTSLFQDDDTPTSYRACKVHHCAILEDGPWAKASPTGMACAVGMHVVRDGEFNVVDLAGRVKHQVRVQDGEAVVSEP